MKKSTRLFLASGAALVAALVAYVVISQEMHETLIEMPLGLAAGIEQAVTPPMSPETAARCQGVLQQIGETTDCAQKLALYRDHLVECQSAVDNSALEEYNPRVGLDSEFTDRIFAISKCYETTGRLDEAKKVFEGIAFPPDYFYITGGSGCPVDKFLPGYLAALDFPADSCLKPEETKTLVMKILNEKQTALWIRLVKRGQFVHFGTHEDAHLPCSGERDELEEAWTKLSAAPGWTLTSERAPELDSPRPSLAYDLTAADQRTLHVGFRLNNNCWALSSLSVPGTPAVDGPLAPETNGVLETPATPPVIREAPETL